MFHQQVSYTTQQSQGAYTATVQREDKDTHPWGNQDFHEGMLACASPTSHSEKDNHKSMTHSANCAPAGASGC